MQFKDRDEAGEKLAARLSTSTYNFDCVFAIPRGGVPVGAILAEKLKIPLRTLISKKIGHPEYPEYAIGAVCMEELLVEPRFQKRFIDHIFAETKRIQNEILEKVNTHQTNPTREDVKGKWIILTDDGAATGYTVLAAIRALKKLQAAKIVVALPILPRETADSIRREAELICLDEVLQFNSVGSFYDSFEPVADEEVDRILVLNQQKTIQSQ